MKKEKEYSVAAGHVAYYVKNAITLGEYKRTIKVVGYDGTKGHEAPYTVTPGHVIEIPEKGAEAPLEKWVRNKCIVPYNAHKHTDAILHPVVYANVDGPDDEDEKPKEEPEDFRQSKAIVDPEEDKLPDKAPAKKSNQSQQIRMRDPRGV